MTGTHVQDESQRALFGWSPPDLPADTALKRRVDRLLPRTGWAAALYCAAVVALLNIAPHLPERGNLAVDASNLVVRINSSGVRSPNATSHTK